MNDHERGYRDYASGNHADAWRDHWSGKRPIVEAADWFMGFQDAIDDEAMSNPPMYD